MSVLDLSMCPATAIKVAPPVVGIRPLGSNILIELLNTQELTSSQIIVADNGSGTTSGPPQAYVLEIGPAITVPEIRALVGKRVILDGKATTLPDYDGHSRTRLLVEYPVIKAVIEEGDPKSSLVR